MLTDCFQIFDLAVDDQSLWPRQGILAIGKAFDK